MTTKTDEVLDLLVQGREFFRAHEWERGGDYYRLGGGGQIKSCCAEGALLAVSERDRRLSGEVWSNARELLHRAIRGPLSYSVTAFNDRGAESKDEILDLYDRAIEARRQELAG